MMKWLTFVLACTCATAALAQEGPDCRAMLADRSLSPALKRGIAAACAHAATSSRCDKQANDRKLGGTARADFMAKCEGSPPARKSGPKR